MPDATMGTLADAVEQIVERVKDSGREVAAMIVITFAAHCDDDGRVWAIGGSGDLITCASMTDATYAAMVETMEAAANFADNDLRMRIGTGGDA
jgi:hypothetical protein